MANLGGFQETRSKRSETLNFSFVISAGLRWYLNSLTMTKVGQDDLI